MAIFSIKQSQRVLPQLTVPWDSCDGNHYVFNQFSIIVGHLVYQHRRLNEFRNSCIADNMICDYTLSGHNC